MTFYDIVGVWQAMQPRLKTGAKLLIISDSCYSGKNVKHLHGLCTHKPHCNGLNIAYQSAGDSRQEVSERTAMHGERAWRDGELTGWWLAKNSLRPGQTPSAVHWSSTRDHPQYPQYIESWDVHGTYDLQGPIKAFEEIFPGGLYFMERHRSRSHA